MPIITINISNDISSKLEEIAFINNKNECSVIEEIINEQITEQHQEIKTKKNYLSQIMYYKTDYINNYQIFFWSMLTSILVWFSTLFFNQIPNVIAGLFSLKATFLFFALTLLSFSLDTILVSISKKTSSWTVELINFTTIGCASFINISFFYSIYSFIKNGFVIENTKHLSLLFCFLGLLGFLYYIRNTHKGFWLLPISTFTFAISYIHILNT